MSSYLCFEKNYAAICENSGEERSGDLTEGEFNLSMIKPDGTCQSSSSFFLINDQFYSNIRIIFLKLSKEAFFVTYDFKFSSAKL